MVNIWNLLVLINKFFNYSWGIKIFIFIFQKKLDVYKFPVYSTPFCPQNESEWGKRSSVLNCNETNGYTCLPNEKRTELLEFCYTQRLILIEEGTWYYIHKIFQLQKDKFMLANWLKTYTTAKKAHSRFHIQDSKIEIQYLY